MTAERADVQNQLDVIMEGIGPTDHVPKGLSILSQFLLYCQQLLNNPGRDPGLYVADWKALRTNAGRATLIRKYQRPFTSLRDDERNRCARFLLSLFEEAVPPSSNRRLSFMGSSTVCFSLVLGTRNTFEVGPSCFETWRKRSLG